MVDEVAELEGACKAKAIAEGERHYYVFFLGTDESARGKGLCSRIVRGYQERAAKEGCPIWVSCEFLTCLGDSGEECLLMMVRWGLGWSIAGSCMRVWGLR